MSHTFCQNQGLFGIAGYLILAKRVVGPASSADDNRWPTTGRSKQYICRRVENASEDDMLGSGIADRRFLNVACCYLLTCERLRSILSRRPGQLEHSQDPGTTDNYSRNCTQPVAGFGGCILGRKDGSFRSMNLGRRPKPSRVDYEHR